MENIRLLKISAATSKPILVRIMRAFIPGAMDSSARS
jgi:hypothetical protein